MSSRNHVAPRVDNFCFSSINEMRFRVYGDNSVKSMITPVAANLASPHGICSVVIQVLHWAVHHNMDVFAIAYNDLFVDLKSYFERKFSEK